MSAGIGEPFACEEHRAVDVLADIAAQGPYVAVVNDPPWSSLAPFAPPPVRVVHAGDMELSHLDALAGEADDGEVIVGLGGGTALDTAKFLAWRRGCALVQMPTITSVDAGFTDAIGVRDERRVRYVGRIVPRLVVLDLELIGSAPKRLNRAGIGDILSCHTGLHDWRAAVAAGHPPEWNDDLAALGTALLVELEAAIDEVAAVTPAGIRFLADAYRRIGAACAVGGHSRFEEGSEHFWAYAYEHATGSHHVHGELIAFSVCAVAHLQDNDADWAKSIVTGSGAVAHPADLGIARSVFCDTVVSLHDYVRAEHLDVGVADLRELTAADAAAAWAFVGTLPRAESGSIR